MAEEQQHGFAFEDWVKRTFFDIHYTSEWDIPKELNPTPENGPISIKTAKWGGGVGFGDASRQFQINHTFTLIVGFWEQKGGHKEIVKIVETIVRQEAWRSLWQPITLDNIESLDRTIKDRTTTPEQARKMAQNILGQDPFSTASFTLNPKIDSKKQRRLQCSLSRRMFFEYLAPALSPQKDPIPTLWGRQVNLKLRGGPRFGA